MITGITPNRKPSSAQTTVLRFLWLAIAARATAEMSAPNDREDDRSDQEWVAAELLDLAFDRARGIGAFRAVHSPVH